MFIRMLVRTGVFSLIYKSLVTLKDATADEPMVALGLLDVVKIPPVAVCCVVTTVVSSIKDKILVGVETAATAATDDEPMIALGMLDVVKIPPVAVCCVVTTVVSSIKDKILVGVETAATDDEPMVALGMLDVVKIPPVAVC